MDKDISFYKENNRANGGVLYCVWLGGENESGVKFSADTIEGVLEQVKNYLIDNAKELFI